MKFDESKKLEPDDIVLIIDYFNLCAEEFLWKTKGRIQEDVWKAWKAGIQENLKIKQIRELFEKETLPFSGQILTTVFIMNSKSSRYQCSPRPLPSYQILKLKLTQTCQ